MMDTFPPTSSLCEKCKCITFDDSNPRFRSFQGGRAGGRKYEIALLDYSFEDTLPDLPALKLRAGCDFCSMLRRLIMSPDQARPDESVRDCLSTMSPCEIAIDLEWTWALSDEYGENPDERTIGLIVLVTFPTEEDEEPPMVTFNFLVGGSGSNHDAVSQCLNLQATPALIDRFGTEPISWIRSRIDSSFDSDTQIEVRTGFLPDRLLDLRYDPIKLVSREEIENEGSAPDSPQRFYAALSYCWGTGGQLLTTRESLEARRIAISKGKMSPLLWDAIQLTRLLEIPYLWIDALCILQGDLQDWNRQSSIMGLIYRNARVTVAIPSSGGCENGFQRNRRETIHIPFTSRVDPDVSGQLSLRYLNRSFDRRDVPLRPAQISYAEIDESQWASRRWTFQEQYLASRLLLLTAAEIYFCTNSVIMHYPTEFEEEVDLLGPGTSLRIENWYDQVVAGYSKRMGFTLGSDVLPALSGVANIFARHLRIESSDYVAGLWNGSLHIGLAWKITDARAVKPPSLSQLLEALQRPSNYMAPSWSWTSRGAVTFPISQSPSVSQDQQCKHLRASTILSGENAYGEVSSGTLSVTARMADLDGELHQSPERSYFRSTEPWKLAAQNNSAWNFYLDWDPEDDVVSLSKAKMVLLGHGENLYQRKFCFGILLHEARGIHGGKFFRIGYFESTNKGNFANFHVQSVGVV